MFRRTSRFCTQVIAHVVNTPGTLFGKPLGEHTFQFDSDIKKR
jgi:hypothetical protein